MTRKTLAVSIVFLFIASTVTPAVISYDEPKESDEFLEKLAHANYDEYISSDYKEYNDPLLNERFADEITSSKSLQTVLSDGPMDSAWPMKCHDLHHTGLSPYSTADNPYDEIWKFKTEGWMRSGVIIDDDGTLYFGSYDRYLYAVYPNGTLKWRYGRTGMWITSSPAIAEDGTIYIGSWGKHLHAVYPNNGTMKWIFDALDTISSSPAIGNDGVIYFGTMGPSYDNGRIYAVNPNGTEKWHYDTGYWITGGPAIADDGTIYIGSGDTYFYALYPNNGTLRWRFKTGHYIKGPPSIADDGTIYIGSWDEYLYALYPNNGTMKWRHKVGLGTESNPSIGPDGTIYCGGGYLYAVNPNGTRKWTFDFGSNKHSHQSSPAISADGTIYISLIIGDDDGDEILAVNPDGTERWRKLIGNNMGQSSPCIGSDGTVYVGSASTTYSGSSYGYVHAFGRGELAADAHGPYIGIINEPVQFTGSASGGYQPYEYYWEFGDEQTSNQQNPSHEYDESGNYTVTLAITDNEDNESIDTTWALIYESNDPPNTPIITGETHGQYGESYDYTFISTDPEDQDVWYYIEWGDDAYEECGPYESGEEVIRSHTWDEQGEFTIRAKAKDIFDAESDWGMLEVTMPVNQQSYSFPLLQRFLERFPNTFPFLRSFIIYTDI